MARRPSGYTVSWTAAWARCPTWPARSVTIADFATWPWLSRWDWQGIDLAAFPNVRRWYVELAARPGVRRGYDVPKFGHAIPLPA